MNDIIIRRDRRAEWILRNRLHPEHASLVTLPTQERGPGGVIRRYPHREGFIGPNGIKRIDRLNGSNVSSLSGSARTIARQEVLLPLHQVTEPDFYITVVPDMSGGRLTSHDRDILGQAHKLVKEYQGQGEGAVMAIIFGPHKETQFDTAGVDRLLTIPDERFADYCPEDKVQMLKAVDDRFAPKHWLFPDSISGGFELGARLAAELHERPATQAWQVTTEETVCRASGGRHDIKRETPRMLLLAEECALPIDETRHEAAPVELDITVEPENHIDDLGQIAVDPQSIPLTEAEFILSAGNGIHDWEQFHRAADVLGATEGASRVAVDDGFMPRHRQVGATGSWVSARLYLAVGISGAIQHLQGIGACEKVVAVNTDPGCDMVKRADLSVIADSNELLSELISLMERYQREEVKDAA
ncbi:electron transfer flavoprotein subunit alpha [Vibrio albus]|uniref:Electron transfer flavoprotein subunit alpha n=1 Tax=Vibrio albus TaxID=2200953 RepID=A0A2U3B9T8_9VIBR|nr:electron transfer flavoprotein subunit alpha/FixB family protein [Vibrio albus]PWI33560.1 electron transfer flavoprotein subunit alpha [Vibrio albus]